MDRVMNEQEMAASAAACELCGRTHLPLTRHHLIPQSRHNKARTKRQFDKQAMKTEIACLCRACHSQVHAVLSNQELAQNYHTIEDLRGQPEIARFAAWIANKPPGLKVTVRSHKGK